MSAMFQHHFVTDAEIIVVTRQHRRWTASVGRDLIETRFSWRMWRWIEQQTSAAVCRDIRKRIKGAA